MGPSLQPKQLPCGQGNLAGYLGNKELIFPIYLI